MSSHRFLLKTDPVDRLSQGVGVEEFSMSLGEHIRIPFAASRFFVEQGCSTPIDVHDDAELWLIARGGGTVRYGSEVIQVSQGQVLLIEPHTPHQVINSGEYPLLIFSLWWPPPSARDGRR